jgi:enamine deaminase RidA (YjgF/YER057c/UK114 family)
MTAEARLAKLGITLPDYRARPFAGAKYGKMRPFRVVGPVLYLCGHVPEADDKVVYPGKLGQTLTTEQGYQAARIAGINVLAGIRHALGNLDRIECLIRSLNFVVCAADYFDINKVANGVTDLLAEVLGPEQGVGCRATIGVEALTQNACFETWTEFQIA